MGSDFITPSDCAPSEDDPPPLVTLSSIGFGQNAFFVEQTAHRGLEIVRPVAPPFGVFPEHLRRKVLRVTTVNAG